MTEMAPALVAAELTATLQRITARNGSFAARVADPIDAAWIDVQVLLEPDAALLDGALDRVMLPYGGAGTIRGNARHVAAAFFINTYAWVLTLATTAAYLTERRVPDLALENVLLRFREPSENRGAFELAFRSERMAVLPDDPAAGLPEVVVVADQAALRTWFRQQVEAHMAPLIEAVHRRTGFSHRGQWNLVADDCAAVFLWVGERIGAEARACAEGHALVGANDSPMCKSRTGYLTLEHEGRCQTFRTRGGCCLYYKVSGRANCSTCPLLSAAERDRRLRETIAAGQTA